MTPADHASTPPDTLVLEFDLKHPPERVWRALTEPALLAEWLLPAIGFKLDVGTAFTFKTNPYPGWDGTVNCRIIEIDPGRKLTYAWSVPFLDTVVTFTLHPTPTGTRLHLVQSGFGADQKREFGGAKYGWTMMSGKLADLLATIA